MSIQIKSTIDQIEIRELCNCYKINELHNYGMMKNWYNNPKNIRCMSLAYDNEPVGCALYLYIEQKKYNTSIFVKEQYRKQGIATSLLQTIQNKIGPVKFLCDAGGYRLFLFQKFDYENRYKKS